MATVRPLDGVRVLDFSRVMSGPWATTMLADHGADVIKVEGLPAGDASREFGVDFIGEQSAVFLMWNRSKRDIALDLRRPEALDIVRRLVRDADVVVENFRPGVAAEIGIGYEQLAAINPRLVYCSISAFGPDGPMSMMPGTDTVVQAASGIMSVTGDPDGQPALVGSPAADFAGAMLAVQGILLALMARERTGRGQHVDISMLFGMIAMLSTRLASYWATGRQPERTGSAHSVLVPYQVFETADGPVMVGAWRQGVWPAFCESVEMPELIDDPRFATNKLRQANKKHLVELLSAVFATRTRDDWERRFLDRGGVLFARVNSFADIMEHPHVKQAGYVESVGHPTLGDIPQLAPVVRLSETPGRITGPPPLLGQHTVEVLAEYGWNAEQIEKLLATGVARHTPPPS
jgi:crotonobetainyl-CoA:carnitine CoA-transferase CaiB-like acyl-CoA transferase